MALCGMKLFLEQKDPKPCIPLVQGLEVKVFFGGGSLVPHTLWTVIFRPLD